MRFYTEKPPVVAEGLSGRALWFGGSFGRGSSVFRLLGGKSAREGVAPLLPRPVDILSRLVQFCNC